MKYLKLTKTADTFFAQFTSGATTDSEDAACFFQIMQDRNVAPTDLESHIKRGETFHSSDHDWKEIRRIAATFTASKGEAA